MSVNLFTYSGTLVCRSILSATWCNITISPRTLPFKSYTARKIWLRRSLASSNSPGPLSTVAAYRSFARLISSDLTTNPTSRYGPHLGPSYLHNTRGSGSLVIEERDIPADVT